MKLNYIAQSVFAVFLAALPTWAAPIDALNFGDAPSEQTHALTTQNSDTITGTLAQSARRLLPLEPQTWEGGTLNFSMKLDPLQPNYFTIKLSGDDITENRLLLFMDDKQIGYRHLGDVEQLDFGTAEPAYAGRFFYNTTPLPLSMTRGKTQANFQIRSSGRIWGYGNTFEQYQKTQTEPSRGIYHVYTHTGGYFVPPTNEEQGVAPANAPLRQEPGPQVLADLKARVNREIDNQLNGDKPLDQMRMQFLAQAYFEPWTNAHHNPRAVQRITDSLDALFVAYRKNPKLATSDPATWNPDWFGFGPAAQALVLLQDQIKPALDGEIRDENGALITRRAAYTEMLVTARDWNREHRRQYTNQTMIVDLYGIYWANRGLQVLAPDRALPESAARRYLYESIGLEPWLGEEKEGVPQKPLGENYLQLTSQGLTRELGYVGTYGEVLDWVTQIYDATRPTPEAAGDAKIKAQLVKIARARAAFRHPALDADGNRAMRLEQIAGWRDSHYPGVIDYAQRASWDGSPLQTAASTLDPTLVGYAQQMLDDNQYFAAMQEQMKDGGFRVTAGLLQWPAQLEIIKAQPPSAQRLPMGWEQPDFVWSDAEDGVVAIKRGQEILYASLYWRARYGINNLARVHDMTPRFDRIAVVHQQSQFTPSGMEYVERDRTNAAFGDWLPKYPGEWHSAHAGQILPIAKIPEGIAFKPGDENIYAGKADFYQLRYGPYFIAMNTTADKTFDLKVPANAQNLVAKQDVKAEQVLQVGPHSTVVLYLP